MAEQPSVRILASRAAAPLLVKELTRRRFFAVTALAGGTAFLAACSSGGAAPSASATGGELEGSVSIYSWGDYDAPEVLEGFTSELGPTVRVDSFGSNEELIAKLVAAKGTGGYDIIV
ncbi:MAG TPA: PotD/PotF family extracellular solute-binding protein, partial [Microbacterium sp.]|nr:PotD/PotF family extracellular solute-binding protein [Microbacterium sp.]